MLRDKVGRDRPREDQPAWRSGKVFGIGLGRTGTMSLVSALNLLGVRSIHYPSDDQTLRELKAARYRLSVLEHYDGAADISIAPYYAELDRAYPGSKFILTVRDKENWLDSIEGHFSNVNNFDYEFARFVHTVTYGCDVFHRERFAHAFDCHTRNVSTYFAERPVDLLVLDICKGDGWEALCSFLGRALPCPLPAFPHDHPRTVGAARSGAS
jgi:Sulfotransferase domain